MSRNCRGWVHKARTKVLSSGGTEVPQATQVKQQEMLKVYMTHGEGQEVLDMSQTLWATV